MKSYCYNFTLYTQKIRKLHKISGSLFILSILLMILSSIVAGTDPRVKIYILTDNEQIISRVKESINRYQNNYLLIITPEDEFNELITLSQTKFIDILIIDPSFDLMRLDLSTLQSFKNINQIVILNDDERRANECINRLTYILREKNVKLESLEKVAEGIASLAETYSPNKSFKHYVALAQLISILSILAIFFGTTIIGSNIIRFSSNENLISGYAKTLELSICIFLIIQATYILCSHLLHQPLALHCTKQPSNPYEAITTYSFLGVFGGGNIPRFTIALVGITLGTLSTLIDTKSSTKHRYSKRGFTLFTASAILCIILALYLGECLGSILGNHSRYLLHLFSLEYQLLSRGIELFFMGCITFYICFYLSGTTLYLFLPPSIFAICWGISRVGNINLLQALASLITSLIISFEVAIVVCAIDFMFFKNIGFFRSKIDFFKRCITFFTIALLICLVVSNFSKDLLFLVNPYIYLITYLIFEKIISINGRGIKRTIIVLGLASIITSTILLVKEVYDGGLLLNSPSMVMIFTLFAALVYKRDIKTYLTDIT